jgi:hypothetical protein
MSHTNKTIILLQIIEIKETTTKIIIITSFHPTTPPQDWHI